MKLLIAKMKFCNICDNMLYLKVVQSSQLEYYCKNCNFTMLESAEGSSVCISQKHLMNDKSSYNSFLNPNIKYDMTLPRVNNIKCPECKDSKDKESEVIYIKYDAENMKYLYYCCKCEHFWKID